MLATSKKRWILFNGLSSYFLSMMMLYQMSPFFQLYAEETTHISGATVGVIFAVLPTSSFFFSPLAGLFIVRVGPPVALWSGLVLLALSTLMFGMSRSVEGWIFWRAVQGAASAPIYTGTAVMFATTFAAPGEFAKVSAWQESIANVGYAVGPLLGGFLFDWGGFTAPFAVSAVIHLLLTFMSFLSLKKRMTVREVRDDKVEPLLDENGTPTDIGDCSETSEPTETVEATEMLTTYNLLLLPAVIIIPGFFGALEPVLGSHWRRSLGDLCSGTIGMMLVLMAVPSTLLALVVPSLMEKFSGLAVLRVGVALTAAGSVLIGLSDPDAMDGPLAPWAFSLEPGSAASWIVQIVLLCVLSSGWSFALTPLMPDMMESTADYVAESRGIDRQAAMEAVATAVSSFASMGLLCGEAIGPALGGYCLERFGFGGSYVMFGLVFFVYLAVLVQFRPLRPAEVGPPGRDAGDAGWAVADKLRLPEAEVLRPG